MRRMPYNSERLEKLGDLIEVEGNDVVIGGHLNVDGNVISEPLVIHKNIDTADEQTIPLSTDQINILKNHFMSVAFYIYINEEGYTYFLRFTYREDTGNYFYLCDEGSGTVYVLEFNPNTNKATFSKITR